ncbi:MAG: HAMP domain-containing histidine kinase [Lachnospiraceae bacterium]|jgi:signal transduction histidine kinase|nr:HAMP domain-containing histidine kinase [Lachnospiraceae bacterium]
MKLWRLYLRQKRTGLLCFGLFAVIFAVTFFLYHLPIEAVMYPVVLCALAGLLFLSLEFGKVYKKHAYLVRLQESVEKTALQLPEVAGIEEKDYQDLVCLLKKSKAEIEEQMTERYMDMIEYYTVWAHQIKTPIASMKLTLQNEDFPVAKGLSEDLFRIEQYVEMVLCYLRLDAQSTDYVIEEYELDEMVKQTVKKLATQFIRKKIQLCYQPLHQRVITDEKWLMFVIEQVLSNAIKYTKAGGSITIRMEEPQVLCICDTGIGIAPEDLPRVFEKGYTGYNGRSDKKASGIGLYLCRRICTNLGHTISINSSLDSGTIVRIHLQQRRIEIE